MAASKAANIIESALKNSMQPVSVEEITGACHSLAQFVCDKKNWFVFCFFLFFFFFFACLYFDYRKYIIFFSEHFFYEEVRTTPGFQAVLRQHISLLLDAYSLKQMSVWSVVEESVNRILKACICFLFPFQSFVTVFQRTVHSPFRNTCTLELYKGLKVQTAGCYLLTSYLPVVLLRRYHNWPAAEFPVDPNTAARSSEAQRSKRMDQCREAAEVRARHIREHQAHGALGR